MKMKITIPVAGKTAEQAVSEVISGICAYLDRAAQNSRVVKGRNNETRAETYMEIKRWISSIEATNDA